MSAEGQEIKMIFLGSLSKKGEKRRFKLNAPLFSDAVPCFHIEQMYFLWGHNQG